MTAAFTEFFLNKTAFKIFNGTSTMREEAIKKTVEVKNYFHFFHRSLESVKQKNSYLSKISTIDGPKMSPLILEISGENENDFLPPPIPRQYLFH